MAACDLAEAMMFEHLERRVLVERQASAVLASAGVEVEIANLDEARARLRAALVEETTSVDPEQMDLLIALGLR